MKIVGHRGAAGLAAENTLASIKKAVSLGVDAVEFDVQLASDGVFVLCHDGHTNGLEINKTPSGKLALSTLDQALDLLTDTIAIIDIKVWDTAEALVAVVKKRGQVIRFTGSYAPDIATCKRLLPKHFAFVGEGHHPWDIFPKARQAHSDGISIHWWLLNPLTYWLARLKHYEIMVYTVDKKWHGKAISLFFPKVWLCTNYPNRFV